MTTEESFEALKSLTKVSCSKCDKKRLYFCYDCLEYMPGVAEKVPQIDLPFSVEIIKHPSEKNSKSTGIHCRLLAPNQTRIFDSKGEIPNFSDASKFPNTVLVYPDKNATSIAEYVRENGPIQRLIVLDATWFTVGGIRQRPELTSLPTVMLRSHKTEYWRPQKGFSDEYLATIEAIRFAIEEASEAAGEPFNGEKLLFWFYYFRQMVDRNIIEKNCENRSAGNSGC